jgi:septal ring factor EnvC (AmiA/AmiB activator)
MRLRQVLPGVVVIVVVLVGSALLWKNNHAERASAPPMASGSSAAPSPASQGPAQQTLADLQHTVKDLQSSRARDEDRINDLQRQLSAEQGERKLLSDQMSTVAGRLDGLEKARAEYTGPARGRRR